MANNDFEGSVIVVTGASTGLGRAICIEVASRGAAAVVINYSSNKTEAEVTAGKVEALGARPLTVKADVGNTVECEEIVSLARSLGRIDALFNNAGVTTFSEDHGDLSAVSMEDFMNIYRVNVAGAYQMIRAARPLLEAAPKTAAIVNTSSLAGVAGIGSSLPYACSKGALVTMTLSLARSLAPKIRVNAVCPGYIATALGSGDEGVDLCEAMTALGRVGTTDDLTGLYHFLASDESSYLTGQALQVDGGWSCGPSKAVLEKVLGRPNVS